MLSCLLKLGDGLYKHNSMCFTRLNDPNHYLELIFAGIVIGLLAGVLKGEWGERVFLGSFMNMNNE